MLLVGLLQFSKTFFEFLNFLVDCPKGICECPFNCNAVSIDSKSAGKSAKPTKVLVCCIMMNEISAFCRLMYKLYEDLFASLIATRAFRVHDQCIRIPHDLDELRKRFVALLLSFYHLIG